MTDYKKEIDRLLKILRKLDFPPSAPNWVRFVCEDIQKTAKAILKFAKGQPQFNYQPAYVVIKDRIEYAISLKDALGAVSAKGAPAGRNQNKKLVEAFFQYDEDRKFSASNPIEFDREYFRASRDVLVPVAPLSIIREKGKFVPIFLCGWTTNPLTELQRRLLMTVSEDAFLSLTDYTKSPAEFLFFPKQDDERKSELWKRGDYKLLKSSEMNDCLENFVSGRDIAREVLLEEIESLRKKAEAEMPKGEELPRGGLPLFDKD